MSPRARRAWGIGIVIFFVVMCAAIAYSQWYSYHVTLPRYQAEHRQK